MVPTPGYLLFLSENMELARRLRYLLMLEVRLMDELYHVKSSCFAVLDIPLCLR